MYVHSNIDLLHRLGSKDRLIHERIDECPINTSLMPHMHAYIEYIHIYIQAYRHINIQFTYLCLLHASPSTVALGINF